MSDLDRTDLLVTAALLRAGVYRADAIPTYPTETLKAAVAGVAKRLTYAPLRGLR